MEMFLEMFLILTSIDESTLLLTASEHLLFLDGTYLLHLGRSPSASIVSILPSLRLFRFQFLRILLPSSQSSYSPSPCSIFRIHIWRTFFTFPASSSEVWWYFSSNLIIYSASSLTLTEHTSVQELKLNLDVDPNIERVVSPFTNRSAAPHVQVSSKADLMHETEWYMYSGKAVRRCGGMHGIRYFEKKPNPR